MPKESAKERKEREKAEALAALQVNERQQFEVSEEKARATMESQEYIERLEQTNEFFAHLVDPKSRLMVRRTEFEEIRDLMQRDALIKSQRMKEITDEYLFMKSNYNTLQLELVHLRGECRSLHQHVKQEHRAIESEVRESLSACIERIHDDILKHRDDVAECGTHLNERLESARLRSARLAASTLKAAEKITAVLFQNEGSGMHTKIPPRIRTAMARMDKDDLMLMLDSLSFEEAVFQYLLYRFPPDPDNPFQ